MKGTYTTDEEIITQRNEKREAGKKKSWTQQKENIHIWGWEREKNQGHLGRGEGTRPEEE